MTTETQIHVERIATMYRQTPTAVVVTAANAILLVGGLNMAGASAPGLDLWLAISLAVAAARALLWAAFLRTRPPPEAMARWARLGAVGAMVAGAVWGVGGAMFMPEAESEQLLWIFVIGGMCAGAAALHYAYLPAALGFLVLSITPVALRFAADGSPRLQILAGMIVVFGLALALTAYRSSAQFGGTLRLRFDLAARTRELDAANIKLVAETTRHAATAASLHQAQKMEAIGQLAGGVAHDFANLLTVVLGSLALLEKQVLPATDAIAAPLGRAREGAERGAALARRLLAFSRRQVVNPQAVDVAILVRGMAPLFASSLGPLTRLELDLPANLPRIVVDPNQLELALLNLAVNARDAMPDGGTVLISSRIERASDGGGAVVLAVADDGAGMDATTLARATEPFFTTKEAGRGTGLGLAMVHLLAAQAGGALRLHSSPGKGTRAELWLPPAPEPVTSAEPAVDVDRTSSGIGSARTVLVVDDDPLVLSTLTAMLADLGHAPVTASSADAALRLLEAGTPVDVVVTDYAMQGMNGLDFAAWLTRNRPALPLLLVTGYAEFDQPVPAGLGRLNKPFDQDALALALDACTRGKAALALAQD